MIPRLLVCIVLACVSNLIWIHMNAAPPRSWDDAEYLSDSVIAFHALEGPRSRVRRVEQAASIRRQFVDPRARLFDPRPLRGISSSWP